MINKEFYLYKDNVNRIKRKESNIMLIYIIMFTERCHRWTGDYEKLVSLLLVCKKRIGLIPKWKDWHNDERMFINTLKQIKGNLEIRGIRIFTSNKNGKTYITVNKNIDDDFSCYFFNESYMESLFVQ